MSVEAPTFFCSALLFDLDGVLIDSTQCVERHWRQWAADHRLDAAVILQEGHGVRNLDTIRKIAAHLDAEAEAALFAAREVADTEGVAAIPGAEALLGSLEGAAWGVVTSCSATLALARLKAAGLATPPMLITGDDVVHGKPEPDPYLMAATRLGIPSVKCVVIEDAPAGIHAASAAGMRLIAVAFTYSRERLSGSADMVVDALSELTVQN